MISVEIVKNSAIRTPKVNLDLKEMSFVCMYLLINSRTIYVWAEV